jgi:cell division protein FtsI/penicillin-binding protein 2
MAAALDQNKVSPSTTYSDSGQRMIEGWKKPIANSDFETAGAHGKVDMKTVLEKSLNLGAIFAMEQIGSKVFSEYVQKFGFGEATGIELSAESTGSISPLLRDKIRPIDAATASFGQGVAVTPLQMVMSYAALANGGVLMKPYLIKEIIKSDGTKVTTPPQELRRVVSSDAARTVSAMLAEVVEKGHSKLAGVSGYYVGGKTGTAQIPSSKGGYLESQYIHTFVGYAPVDKPRFVMLVKLDKPKGFQFAESSAAPIFGDIAAFLLNYYQVPKERDN